VLTLRYAAETPRTPRAIDLPGQALAVVALGAVAAATIAGGRSGLALPVLLGYAGAVVAPAGFLLVESRRREPTLPLTLFRSRTFAASSAIGLLINIAFYGLIFVLSLYFQTVRGWSAPATGAAFLPATVAVLVANLLAGRLVGALGLRREVAGSALLVAAALAGLLVAGPSSAFATLAAPLVVLGFGLGALVPAASSGSPCSVRSPTGVSSPACGSRSSCRSSWPSARWPSPWPSRERTPDPT
jgi:MFS transporter, DHA2 family, methylenomycin A resistance protein